jgi:hypothetical protein
MTMYDPTIGEFIEGDVIGFDGEDFNPRRYCRNSPANYLQASTGPVDAALTLLFPGDAAQTGSVGILCSEGASGGGTPVKGPTPQTQPNFGTSPANDHRAVAPAAGVLYVLPGKGDQRAQFWTLYYEPVKPNTPPSAVPKAGPMEPRELPPGATAGARPLKDANSKVAPKPAKPAAGEPDSWVFQPTLPWSVIEAAEPKVVVPYRRPMSKQESERLENLLKNRAAIENSLWNAKSDSATEAARRQLLRQDGLIHEFIYGTGRR